MVHREQPQRQDYQVKNKYPRVWVGMRDGVLEPEPPQDLAFSPTQRPLLRLLQQPQLLPSLDWLQQVQMHTRAGVCHVKFLCPACRIQYDDMHCDAYSAY